jgi:hypothetical protein
MNRSGRFAATQPEQLDAPQRIFVHATAQVIGCEMPNRSEEPMPITQQYRVMEISIPLLQQASPLADRHVLRAYGTIGGQ